MEDALRVIAKKVEKRPHNMLLDPGDLVVLPGIRAIPRLQDCHLEEPAKHVIKFQAALNDLRGQQEQQGQQLSRALIVVREQDCGTGESATDVPDLPQLGQQGV